MNLVQTQQNDPHHRQRQILAAIHAAITSIPDSLELETTASQNPEHQRIRYVTTLHFKEITEKLKLLWQFKILTHVLIIKLSLLDSQPLAHEIHSLCRKNRQKVIFFFNHINNISFNENEGEFYVHGDSKILYQYREDNWYALNNPFKLKHHLQNKLNKIALMFKLNLENFLTHFKLLPNLVLQKQHLQKIQQLNQIKYFFEENKKNPAYPPELHQNIARCRKNHTEIDLDKVAKFDEKILALIEGKFPQPKTTPPSTTNPSAYQKLQLQFKSKTTQYTTPAEHKDLPYPLVIAMQVLEVKNETLLKDSGGFGRITRALYSCKYGKTVFDDINKQLQTENFFSEQIFTRYLCQKSALSQKCEAFQNEKQALMKLRNKKSPHIAQYYCNISKGKPFDDPHIYLDVYTSNIDEIPIKLKHKLKILCEVIKGLYFLNSNGILHRDMKPENVVVDRQMNSKIIDFGSCSNVYQREDLFKPHDSKLRSTKGFFAKYETYHSALNKKTPPLTKQQFYEHYLFDVYSYGKIVEKLFNLGEFQFVEEDLLMSQVFYLSQKCCELNPADRLSHEEIQFFLQKVIELHNDTLA